MPRGPRKISNTGIYHIILRGINKQNIFMDKEDKLKFIDTLQLYKDKGFYQIYGYCLMDNHTHSLFKEKDEYIGESLKRIGSSYVFWYNKKYERSGPLFQDRFKSEAVEDDRYLLSVLRYIHQNPLKAGMVKNIGDYRWSSYNDFLNRRTGLTDTRFILDLFHVNEQDAIPLFKNFMAQSTEEKFLDHDTGRKIKITDEEVLSYLKQNLSTDNLDFLKQLSIQERDIVIRELKRKGATIKQLTDLTGLGRRIIQKA